jgi:hypothetical protein
MREMGHGRGAHTRCGERASVTYWCLSMVGYLLTYLTLSTLPRHLRYLLEMTYLSILVLGTIPYL